LIFRKWKR